MLTMPAGVMGLGQSSYSLGESRDKRRYPGRSRKIWENQGNFFGVEEYVFQTKSGNFSTVFINGR